MEEDKSKALATIMARDTATMQTTSNIVVSNKSQHRDAFNITTDDDKTEDRSLPTITDKQQDVLNKLDLAPATLEALKTLSAIGANEGIDKFSICDKLTASLEQIRAKKNMKLFEKLDKIRQDFSGLNHKIAKMEESIYDLREVTNNLVKSLPPTSGERRVPTANVDKNSNNDDKRRTSTAK